MRDDVSDRRLQARFDAAMRSPEYADAMADGMDLTPPHAGEWLRQGVTVLLLVPSTLLFIVVGFVMIVRGRAPWIFLPLWAAGSALFSFASLTVIRKARLFVRTPAEPQLVVVVDRRTYVDAAFDTQYHFITIATRDGRSVELDVGDGRFDVSVGEIGVARIEGDKLLAFRRC